MAFFRAPARSILEFERNVELGTVGFDLALGIQLQIEFHDFRDTKFPQGFSSPVDRGLGRLLPGILAGTDQFNDFVDALRHIVLPFGFRQEAGAPAGGKPNIGISALKAAIGQSKARPAKPGARLLSVRDLPYVEYLNSGIAFSSSLVALYTAWSGYQGLGFDVVAVAGAGLVVAEPVVVDDAGRLPGALGPFDAPV